MKYKNNKITISFISLILALSFGCATPEIRQANNTLDTPQHHYYIGTELFKDGKINEAEREFDLALQLDPTFSPALSGLGITQAQKGEFVKAKKTLRQAVEKAETDKEKARAWIGFMRLHLAQKGKSWLKKVEKYYRKSLHYNDEIPDSYFYMGMAYKEAFELEKAEIEFEKVLDLNKAYVNEADTQLKLAQKIQRALPGSRLGKKLVFKDKITRAEVSAIFIQELGLDRLLGEKRGKTSGLSTIPNDIKDNVLREDIIKVLKIGLRGLKLFPDGGFHPDENITRASYAMMIEDILTAITHDNSIPVIQVGSNSPFSDVKPDSPFFNAIMTCTTRGIMEIEDIQNDAFDPNGYVNGADALITIRKLKAIMKGSM